MAIHKNVLKGEKRQSLRFWQVAAIQLGAQMVYGATKSSTVIVLQGHGYMLASDIYKPCQCVVKKKIVAKVRGILFSNRNMRMGMIGIACTKTL